MRKLSSDALLVFGADTGARLLGFLASAHLARTLSREGFGLIVIGMAYLSYVLWFVDLGIGTLGTRELGRPAGARTYAPNQILWTRIALSLAVLAPAAALAVVLYPGEPQRTIILAYLLNTVGYALLLEWYYQGVRNYVPLVISRTMSAAIYLGLLYALVHEAADVQRVPLLFVGGNLIAALVLLGIGRGEHSLSPRGLKVSASLSLIRQAGMIGIGGVVAQTVQLLPPLVLGAYSTSQAGLFGAALRIVSMLLVLDRVFAVLFLPAVTRRLSARDENAAPDIERTLRLVITIGFATALGVAASAPALMRIVYGDAFVAGAPALAIGAWFAAATLVNSVFMYGLIGAGSERAYFRATMASGATTVALTIVLTHVWGLVGAAVSMVASELIVVGITYAHFRRVVRVAWLRPLALAAVIGAALTAGLLIMQPAGDGLIMIAAAIGAATLFVAAMIATGGLRRADLTWILER